MAKLENNLKNMVLSLTVITVLVGALLGFVASVTKEPIRQAEVKAQQDAIAAVFPDGFEQVGDRVETQSANEMDAVVFPLLRGGQVVGRAVEVVTKQGFGGKCKVMFGFDTEGNITGYNVLDCSQETPGLGAKMPDWFQADGRGNVIGKNPGRNNMTVSKDGGEVDAITAATISSRAFCDAIAQAYGLLPAADATTSATRQAEGGDGEGGEADIDAARVALDAAATAAEDVLEAAK